uniref:Uncharacterized protein n=1 Tax=Oryza brachyantha TaxID=4533 RepID=J3N7U0_ORYBR
MAAATPVGSGGDLAREKEGKESNGCGDSDDYLDFGGWESVVANSEEMASAARMEPTASSRWRRQFRRRWHLQVRGEDEGRQGLCFLCGWRLEKRDEEEVWRETNVVARRSGGEVMTTEQYDFQSVWLRRGGGGGGRTTATRGRQRGSSSCVVEAAARQGDKDGNDNAAIGCGCSCLLCLAGNRGKELEVV